MEFFHEIVDLKTRVATLEAALAKLMEPALPPTLPEPGVISDEEIAFHVAQHEKEMS